MKKEEWKDLPDFEDYIMVSSLGRVWDKKRNEEKYVSVYKNGYVYFEFWINKVRHRYRLHIVVAQLFNPNPENKKEVHHIDETRLNNRKDNLIWVTHEEHKELHKQTGTRGKRIGNRLRNHPNMSKPVEQYNIDGVFIADYPSCEEAARQTGCSRGNISNCCTGRYSQTKGFIFRFKKVV